MSDPVKFLRDAMGLDLNRNARHQPGDLLEAINSGQLHLDPDIMRTPHGADVLNALVAGVCQRGVSFIRQMDEHSPSRERTMEAYDAVVERLIQAGVDPWMAGRDGESAWEIAITRGWEDACLRFLEHPSAARGTALGNGEKVSYPGEEREYSDPWIVAAARHSMDRLLPRLLEHATELNKVDFTGNSALHHASTAKIAAMLLDAGVDPGILNRRGTSAEENWTQRAQRDELDGREARKMAATLLMKRCEQGDARTHAADLVAAAGQHMGVRDGEPILRQAGWQEPKRALTSKQQTIFTTRAEDALHRGLRLPGDTNFVNPSETLSRMAKIIAWMDKKAPQPHEQGIARVLAWVLRGVDSSRGWSGNKRYEIDKFEKKHKLQCDTSPAFQQQAIEAIKDAVSRGAIGNGSFVSALCLMEVFSRGTDLAALFRSTHGQDPLLIQWLDMVYRGMGDPAWNTPEAFSSTTRPDIPINRIFETLETRLAHAGDDFWAHPKLPGLFLRLMGSKLGGNAKDTYFDPLNATYDRPADSFVLSMAKHADNWIMAMSPAAVMEEVQADPISWRVFDGLRAHLPVVASMTEQMAIDQSTQSARAPTRRRSL